MQRIARNVLCILVSVIVSVNIVFVATNSEEEHFAKIPILLYHNIIDNLECDNVLVNITPDNLRAHLEAIRSAGYESITFDDYYQYIANGKKLPEKPIIITFDDGYLSNYEFAYPILKELNMKATIFIITSTVGAAQNVSYSHFSWEQAKEMEDSGIIDIQSHTHSHMEIPSLDEKTIEEELRLSKYLIEANLQKQCDYFSYPFGMYNELSLKIGNEAGYKLQCRLGNTGYNTKNTPKDRLRRITVWGDKNSDELLSILDKNLALDYNLE